VVIGAPVAIGAGINGSLRCWRLANDCRLRGHTSVRAPPGEAERRAERAAGRAPLDARTGRPSGSGVDAEDDSAELADTGDVEPHDHQ